MLSEEAVIKRVVIPELDAMKHLPIFFLYIQKRQEKNF